MINKNDLLEYFFKGLKSKNDLKIGVEHEKFALNKNSFKPLSYDEVGGLTDIFIQLINLGWSPIKEGIPEKIIALKKNSEFFNAVITPVKFFCEQSIKYFFESV